MEKTLKRQNWGQYFAAGITAFTVIAAAILLFFLLDHFSFVRSLAGTVFYILRPIFYGMVLAFLLLPVLCLGRDDIFLLVACMLT